jgi:hypothetical protein
MIKCQYYVYLLKSEVSNRYYIGFTLHKNIKTRRLAQHNGEIQGGAKKTKKYRPWKYVMYVSGFLYEKTALQYEFCIHKYRKFVPSSKKYKGLEKWIYIMHTLLHKEKICSTAIPNRENKYIVFFHNQSALKYWNNFSL